jgi:hypothetical protein
MSGISNSPFSGSMTVPGIYFPGFILGPNGTQYVGAMGNAIDALQEKFLQANLAKCPGFGDPSLIPYQAADRVMVQGVTEPNSSFIVRLKNAFNSWGRVGGRPAVLEQEQGYLTDSQPGVNPAWPQALIVGTNGTIATWDVIYGSTPQGAPPAHEVVTPSNWDWDSNLGSILPRNYRAWLVLFMNLVNVAGLSGTAASITSTGGSGVFGVTSGFFTVTGLTGMGIAQNQQYLTISGAGSAANNGTFQIVHVLSSTSAICANRSAVAPDANNGALVWSVAQYPFIGPAPVWGSPQFVWGSGTGQWPTWGVNCSHFVIESIRNILMTWKSAVTFYPNIIISFGGGDGTAGKEFSPLSAEGAGNPDGTWGGIGKPSGFGWIPAKTPLNQFTAFADGTGISVSCQEKNRT